MGVGDGREEMDGGDGSGRTLLEEDETRSNRSEPQGRSMTCASEPTNEPAHSSRANLR